MPTFPATRIDSQTCSMALSAPGLPRTASRKSWSMRLPTLSPKASTRSLIRRTSSSFHGGSALSPALFTTRPSSVYVGPPGPLVVTHSTPIRAMKVRAWSYSPKAGMVSLIVPFNSAAIPSGATPGRAKTPGRAPDHVYGHADDVRHGGFVERDILGYREEKFRPSQTVLGVGARVVIHLSSPLSMTQVNRVPAQILAAGAAEIALATRTKRLHSDASAEQESVCGRVNLDHDSGIFVSEDNIGRVWDVAAQRVQRPRIIPLPITQVATADSASFHLDQNVVLGRQPRLRDVGPVELSRLPQNNSLHPQAPSGPISQIEFYQAAAIPFRRRGEEASLSQLLFRRFQPRMVKHSSRPVSYLVKNVPMPTSLEMSPCAARTKSFHSLFPVKWFGIAVGSVKAARRLCARRRGALTGPTAMQIICGEGMEGARKGGHF